MRMPRYDVRNDGAGPYAVFYCEKCYREFRSQPNLGSTIGKEVGRAALGGLLRNIPVVGYDLANSTQDPRYSRNLNQQQLDDAWNQVIGQFHWCETCGQVVCSSDWDPQTNFCTQDSPRRAQIAQAQTEQAIGMAQGVAAAFGLGGVINRAAQAAQAAATLAYCSQCRTPAPAGTKFCPRCGGAMVQPQVPAAALPTTCPTCQASVAPGMAFCGNCGTKMAPATPAPAAALPANCPTCGAPIKSRFCGACGTKVG